MYSLITYLYIKNNNENIKELISKNFFELIEEQDYNYWSSKDRPLKSLKEF